MTFRHSILALVAVVAVASWGCASGPDEPGDVDANDTQVAEDTADATDMSADGQDADMPDAAGYDREPWLEDPGDCGSSTTFAPVSTDPFAKPDNPDITDRHTVDSYWSAVGRSSLQGLTVTADNKHEPIADVDRTTIYGATGEDVEFHLVVLNNYDDLSSFQISVTAMVDYEPAEASYVRLSGDRQSELERYDAVTGIGFQADRKVELIDVTIPASRIEAGRMNEVSIAVQTHTVERRPFGGFFRFELFYGGWERPAKPCIHPAQAAEALRPENTMRAIFSGSRGFTFFGPFSDALEFRERKQVSPGESVRIYFSLLAWEQPKDYAMVPVLNGKPIGPIWWAEQSLHDPEDIRDPRNIDARRYVDLTMPDEPGVYNFQVIAWPDPFELREFPDGTINEDVNTTEFFGGSNHLTFEVVEESGN